MRWLTVLLKGKQEQAGAQRRRNLFRAASHAGAASPPTSTDDDDQDIPSSFPQSQAHTGPGSLPFDLFTSILKLAISLESESDSEFSPTNDIRALHVVNSVCRHWRWTALRSPSLWACIPPHLPLRLVKLFLRRSGDALLNVDLVYVHHFGNPRNPRAGVVDLLRKEGEFLGKLANVLNQAHRIRFLSLRLSASALAAIDFELARTGAHCRTPILEGFRLQNSTEYHWRPPKENFVSDAELSLFIKFRSSVLRELDFNGTMVPCDSIPLMSLSRLLLTLTGSSIAAEGYLTNILSRGSRLVALTLYLSVEVSAARTQIPLPELRQLSLRGTCRQCAAVYRMLSAPLLEEIRLETGYSSVENAALFIPPRLGGDLRVEVGVYIIRLEFSESRSLARGKKWCFSLTQCGSGIGVSNNYILLNLLKPHHFAEVTSIEFSTAYAFDSTFMTLFLLHFYALHSLHMHFTNTSESESDFHIEDAISLSMLRSALSPLYNLQRLTFRNFAVVMPQASPFLIELCAIVRGRGKAGLPDLVPEFEDCRGVTHALLRACGLQAS